MRFVFVALPALLLGLLAVDVVTMGIGSAYARSNPDLARKWRSDLPAAIVADAQRKGARGDAERARSLSLQAVAADPLNVAALRTLGLTFASSGDEARAEAVMTVASRLSRRDIPVQSWLVERKLAEGDYESALYHADALMRRSPAASRTIVPLLSSSASGPEGTRFLVARLAEGPPWRTRMLNELTLAAPETTRAVLLGLRSTPTPPTTSEVQPYLALLIGARRYSQAHEDWLLLSPSASKEIPYDGEFKGGRAAMPFNWSLPSSSGASAELTDAPDDLGARALLVSYDGFSQPPLPRQLMALAPGRYRLTGSAYTLTPEAHRRLRWRISCADSSALLGVTASEGAAAAWDSFEVWFEVPETECSAQWLALQPLAGERRAGVQIWYRNLAVNAAG